MNFQRVADLLDLKQIEGFRRDRTSPCKLKQTPVDSERIGRTIGKWQLYQCRSGRAFVFHKAGSKCFLSVASRSSLVIPHFKNCYRCFLLR